MIHSAPTTDITAASRWHALADHVLSGEPATKDDARAILESRDAELLDLLSAAYRIRSHYYGNTVKLNFLVNAQSGVCQEDCGYCSQARTSTADIPKYKLMQPDEIAAKADRAVELGATTCCIVIAARGPNDKQVEKVCDAVRGVKDKHPDLRICACLGLINDEQARALKDAGVSRYNHNLNTSERFYDEICSTHSYADRVATIQAAKAAGMSPCAGGIAGMGETHEDMVEMAFALRALDADSIPVNFLHAIKGTALQDKDALNPRDCLRQLAMFRFVNPTKEIRISGGREVNLRSLQPLGLYAANAMFVADYLTTPGQAPSLDAQMIEDLGFTVETTAAFTTAKDVEGGGGS